MLDLFQWPSWFCNNIFLCKGKARFCFPFLVMKYASVVASKDRLERLCQTGSNSSDTGRDILMKNAIKGILHRPLKAVESVVDAPKATFYSVLKESEWDAENLFIIYFFAEVLKAKCGNLVLRKFIFGTCSKKVRNLEPDYLPEPNYSLPSNREA